MNKGDIKNMYPYDINSFSNFNNFNPYNMGNFVQNANNYSQQMQQPQQMQQQANGLDIVTVQNVQQVEQVQINPGQRRLVMVQNEPVVAMRTADNMGLASTEYYQLVKFDPTARTNVQNVDCNKYITEEQLEARLRELMETINKKGAGKNEPITRNNDE